MFGSISKKGEKGDTHTGGWELPGTFDELDQGGGSVKVLVGCLKGFSLAACAENICFLFS